VAVHYPEINQELIDACIRGDRLAQYRFYKQYSRSMYNLCIRMVPDQTEAEDLLQEAFVRAFRELGSLRGWGAPGAWLRRIIINGCLNHLRKKRGLFIPLPEAGLADIPDEESDVQVVSPEEINRAIRLLPEGARVVFILHLLEGYKHAEIGGMLGISESTSKSQYRRAIALLKNQLTEKNYAGQAGAVS